MNIELATEIIKKLNDLGVVDFLVCAGARNAPLVKVLSQADGVNVQHFYDERAAGFYALGRARRRNRPVAVLTTSGTAVAELLPATIEAHYSNVPLVLVTADRPRHYRGSGAPQTIEQVGLFSVYVENVFDVAKQIDVEPIVIAGPTHINVCFDEPLIDAPVSKLSLSEKLFSRQLTRRRSSAEVEVFFNKVKRPLVVLGAVHEAVRGRVLEFLTTLAAPIYAEAQSGLRECPELADFTLRAGEGALSAEMVRENFDGLLRIGSVPTLRLWRDLDLSLAALPVLSVSDIEFTGLARDQQVAISYSDFFENSSVAELKGQPRAANAVLAADHRRRAQLEGLFEELPVAEPSLFRTLSNEIAIKDLVFVGNSLPIREWDLAANPGHTHERVYANRGANGIDGLLATFLGLSDVEQTNWLLLGDLSALYDLNALSLADPKQKIRIVVINNSGGHIFERMFNDKAFLNAHNWRFQKWAEMFGFEYLCIEGDKRPAADCLCVDAQHAVIEIRPEPQQTKEFWRRYAEICR